VSFVSRVGQGARFDLGADRHAISVRLADATGLDLSKLLNARVRITGVGHGVMTLDQTLVLGKLFAASAQTRDSSDPIVETERAATRLPLAHRKQAVPRSVIT